MWFRTHCSIHLPCTSSILLGLQYFPLLPPSALFPEAFVSLVIPADIRAEFWFQTVNYLRKSEYIIHFIHCGPAPRTSESNLLFFHCPFLFFQRFVSRKGRPIENLLLRQLGNHEKELPTQHYYAHNKRVVHSICKKIKSGLCFTVELIRSGFHQESGDILEKSKYCDRAVLSFHTQCTAKSCLFTKGTTARTFASTIRTWLTLEALGAGPTRRCPASEGAGSIVPLRNDTYF